LNGSDEQYVRACLAAAGLDPPPDDVDELVRAYPSVRAMVESLRLVPEAKDDFPELVLRVDPTVS
jgi:hypothetical protein